MKIISMIILFLGEALSIFAELYFAGILLHQNNTFKGTIAIFIKMLLVVVVAGSLLLLGYYFGYYSFKDIWVVSVISVVSIIIAEPILNFIFFKTLPGRGAIIGFIFGVLGMAATLVL